MGYAFMTFEKIKTTAQLVGKYNHNYREIEVANADKDKSHLNEELVSLNGDTYVEAYQKRLRSLGYGMTKEERKKDPTLKSVRKNAVLGLEVVTTFSRDDAEHIDIEKWKEDNVKWLRETFNPSEKAMKEHSDNVLSVMYHGDEAGNVHCHAVIIPIDEKGHLNARYYVQNRQKLIEMQDSYGELMSKNHNLNRGLKGSRATHKDIKKFYTALNMNLEKTLPPPFLQESAFDYRERANELFTQANLKAMGLEEENKRLKEEIEQIKRNYKSEAMKEVAKEFELGEVRELKREFGSVEQARKEARILDDVNAGIKTLSDPDAETITRVLNELKLKGQKKKKRELEEKKAR